MDAKTVIFIVAVSFSVFQAATSQAAVQSATQVPCPVNEKADQSGADPNLAQWIRKRALYLHDLKLSSFEEKKEPLSPTDLNIADKLVDAGLYIAYAEADRLALDQSISADVDMQQALDRLDLAYDLAAGDVKDKIAKTRTKLESTRDEMLVCHGEDFRQQRKEYEALRRDIGHLVNAIG